jgi:hypothetical protein
MRRSERSQAIASERVIAYGIIAPRRSNSAHLHRPWRAIIRQSTLRRPDLRQASRICSTLFPGLLFAVLVRWKRQVTRQVHLVVQDTADFNDPPLNDPI